MLAAPRYGPIVAEKPEEERGSFPRRELMVAAIGERQFLNDPLLHPRLGCGGESASCCPIPGANPDQVLHFRRCFSCPA